MAEHQSPHYHVFLSHNSRDKGAVEPLAVMLREKGLNPFLDKWNLVPGEPIEDALIAALENSDSAVIFVGPGGEGPWQSEEMRDILKRAVKSHNEFRAIPVLLPNASAEALEKSFLGSRLWIEFKDVDDDDALLRLAKAIQGEAYGDESFALPDEPAPYRGLERFERIENPDEDFFFGRDDEIGALVERLVKERFVAVVGASGSGKSSLIRAGLTKQLAEEIHSGIRRWQTITVEPGSAPFRSLAVQVAVAAGIPVADREDWIEKSVQKWRASPDSVRSSLETLFADAKEPMLVFIDQFEELFTHRREGEENERISRNFVANLADIWRHGGDRVRVVVALRADFIDRCLEIGPLKELLQDRTMLVGEVGDDALREIVKEPAARVGAFLEKGLMERILTEVHSQSGSLPLLQQALHELWRHRRGAWLTHEAYDASGGVARALNDQAQGAYKALDDAQKKIADGLFPRLITLGEGVADTRRRVKRNELYPEEVEPSAVNEVIDMLSGKDARILVTTREGATAEDLGSGEDFVEFTHEALLGNWEHLATLLDSERESIRKHRSLTTAAEEWESTSEAERQKFLLHHGQLEITEQWATDEGGYARLNQLERQFLDESIQERTAEEARKAKIARRLKIFGIGMTAVGIVAIAASLIALHMWASVDALHEHAKAINLGFFSSQFLEDGDPTRALRVGQAGYEIDPENVPPSVKRAILNGYAYVVSNNSGLYKNILLHKDAVNYAVFSPDGSKLVTASKDGTAKLWDKDGRLLKEMKQGEAIQHVAFTHDGKKIITVGYGHLVKMWDADGNYIRDLIGHGCSPQFNFCNVNKVAVAPDDQTIVTVSSDQNVIMWNSEGEKLKQLNDHASLNGWVVNVTFSSDGKYFATSGWEQDRSVQLYDVKGNHIASLTEDNCTEERRWNCGISDVAFSPDGEFLLTSSADKTVKMYDLQGNHLKTLTDHSARVNSVVFSPDGRYFLSASNDGAAILWNKDGSMKTKLVGHTDFVTSAVFSPDETYIATSSNDKTARLWDLEGNILAQFEGHKAGVKSVVFSPDAKYIVTASGDKTGLLWRVPQENAGVLKHDGEVVSAQFLPDGKRILTASNDMTVRLWNADPTKLLKTYEGFGPDNSPNKNKRIWSLDISPNGERFITTGTDYKIRIWEIETGEIIREWGKRTNDNCTATGWCGAINARYSFDGQYVITSDFGGAVQVLDSEGKLIRTIQAYKEGANADGHSLEVNGIDISRDNQYIVTGSHDKTIKLWDFKTGKLEKTLTGHTRPVSWVNFSSKGDKVLSASHDQTVKLWDLSGEILLDIPAHAGQVSSAEFSPTTEQIISSSFDKTAKIWDIKGNLVRSIHAHNKYLRSAYFSPQGDNIITASGDTTATYSLSLKSTYEWIRNKEMYKLTSKDWRELDFLGD